MYMRTKRDFCIDKNGVSMTNAHRYRRHKIIKSSILTSKKKMFRPSLFIVNTHKHIARWKCYIHLKYPGTLTISNIFQKESLVKTLRVGSFFHIFRRLHFLFNPNMIRLLKVMWWKWDFAYTVYRLVFTQICNSDISLLLII